TNENFQIAMNFSLMVMMNYLLLGELLTSLSHFNLLMQKDIKSFQINVSEFADSIVINWNPKHKLSTEFMHSRLFLHLLDAQQLQISFDESELKLFRFKDDFAEIADI